MIKGAQVVMVYGSNNKYCQLQVKLEKPLEFADEINLNIPEWVYEMEEFQAEDFLLKLASMINSDINHEKQRKDGYHFSKDDEKTPCDICAWRRNERKCGACTQDKDEDEKGNLIEENINRCLACFYLHTDPCDNCTHYSEWEKKFPEDKDRFFTTEV